MTTNTRRAQQKQQTRQAILDAARHIAAHEGWQAVTIRKIADRIDYRSPVIYEYFESKDALLLELVREGFASLLTDLTSARASDPDPDVAMQRIVRAYCTFAWRNPDLYQAMYGLGGAPFRATDTWGEGMRIGDIVAATLMEIAARDQRPWDDIGGKVLLLWGSVHGLIALAMAGRIAGEQEQVTRAAEQVVHDLLIAWGNTSRPSAITN